MPTPTPTRSIDSDSTPRRGAAVTTISRVRLILIITGLVVAALVAGYLLGNRVPDSPNPAPTIDQPVSGQAGDVLVIPNQDARGDAGPLTQYIAGTTPEQAHQMTEAPGTELVAEITIPISGPCPIGADGVIGAPDDWTSGCYYQDERGGLAYVGHAVRGPIAGAFENIGNLELGDAVSINGDEFQVGRVSVFPEDSLPDYLWQKGRISLVTCFIDAGVDKGEEFSKTTIVHLDDV